MAATLIGDLKGIFSVKEKDRLDPILDQYSRRFMVKILLLSAVAIGLRWLGDKLTCIVPDTHSISGGFIAEACWINGFYVYREIRHQKNNLGYYGIPNDIGNDGMYADGSLCSTTTPGGKADAACISMTKTFFLQYQWYPFFLAALGLFFYIPYMVYKIANTDLISLRKAIADSNDENIANNFFNYKINSPTRMRIRILINVLVKLCYIIANVIAFLLIDKTLNGNFKAYGKRWVDWAVLPDDIMYDYIHDRAQSKPGELMLPTFGLCEVLEGARDARHTISNRHKFICEYSPNVLYHYVLVALWFFIVFGIIVSASGFIASLLNYAMITSGGFLQSPRLKKLSKGLYLREGEYLELLRKKNRDLYDAVVNRLLRDRFDASLLSDSPLNEADRVPMYKDLRDRLRNMNQAEILEEKL